MRMLVLANDIKEGCATSSGCQAVNDLIVNRMSSALSSLAQLGVQRNRKSHCCLNVSGFLLFKICHHAIFARFGLQVL